MGKIYTDQGWVNWDYLADQASAFCMVVGARGTGKTYGLLKYLINTGKKFIYLRRLYSQLESCAGDGNPFKAVNEELQRDIRPLKMKGSILFSDPGEDPVAVGLALSTFANVRGVDFSDVDYVLFDEAVAMSTERPIKDEFSAFLNLYETVNRNRELQGKPPVKCFLLGNANRLANVYFAGWEFMRTALKMIHGGQMMWRSADGTRCMVLLLDSPISKRKAETALYSNARQDFIAMALDNAFAVDPTNIKPAKLSEYTHVVSVGEIGIYRNKGTGDHYVSKTVNKDNYYDAYGIKLKMFQRDYCLLKDCYLDRLLTFESYDIELIFREYFNLI